MSTVIMSPTTGITMVKTLMVTITKTGTAALATRIMVEAVVSALFLKNTPSDTNTTLKSTTR